MTSATLHDRAEFEKRWPKDDETFAALLASRDIDGAETTFVVTPLAVALARAFLSLSRRDINKPLIRSLLVNASLISEMPWIRRLLVLLFDHAVEIPGLPTDAIAQIRCIGDAHRNEGEAGVTPASWRFERKAAMALADTYERNSIESLVLKFVAALAWPLAIAADCIGPSIWLLRNAKARGMVREADFPVPDRVAIEALLCRCVEDARAAEARGERTETPSVMDLARKRDPRLIRLHENRVAFELKAYEEALHILLYDVCALAASQNPSFVPYDQANRSRIC